MVFINLHHRLGEAQSTVGVIRRCLGKPSTRVIAFFLVLLSNKHIMSQEDISHVWPTLNLEPHVTEMVVSCGTWTPLSTLSEKLGRTTIEAANLDSFVDQYEQQYDHLRDLVTASQSHMESLKTSFLAYITLNPSESSRQNSSNRRNHNKVIKSADAHASTMGRVYKTTEPLQYGTVTSTGAKDREECMCCKKHKLGRYSGYRPGNCHSQLCTS